MCWQNDIICLECLSDTFSPALKGLHFMCMRRRGKEEAAQEGSSCPWGMWLLASSWHHWGSPQFNLHALWAALLWTQTMCSASWGIRCSRSTFGSFKAMVLFAKYVIFILPDVRECELCLKALQDGSCCGVSLSMCTITSIHLTQFYTLLLYSWSGLKSVHSSTKKMKQQLHCVVTGDFKVSYTMPGEIVSLCCNYSEGQLIRWCKSA